MKIIKDKIKNQEADISAHINESLTNWSYMPDECSYVLIWKRSMLFAGGAKLYAESVWRRKVVCRSVKEY